MGVGRLSTAWRGLRLLSRRLIPRHKHCKTMVTTSTQEACCVFPSGGMEHQVFSVQDEFLILFLGCQTHGAKGRALSRVPLMIRNHPCQPWEGRWSVGLPVWTTSRLPPLKMQRETTVDDRSSCTVMSVVMCGISLRGGCCRGARASTLLVLSRPSGRGGAAREA